MELCFTWDSLPSSSTKTIETALGSSSEHCDEINVSSRSSTSVFLSNEKEMDEYLE